MSIFILTFAIFLIVVIAMSIGMIVQRKSISGSCGGIGAIGMDKACDCDDPCDKRKKKMAREKAWQENRIL
ncbi:(Na+)-NQR maturation NqrM [Flocculibacter collagenilyticus]|uniref:(Na+)-NQR maturation NqrM n=1 Tax=Flocculibacter collagenilyticus TaxID=2744479 RepID=UPI0018F79079|nr:(Na+)-NQR maturation NqrM [Flocculibacter collagenilyticus]